MIKYRSKIIVIDYKINLYIGVTKSERSNKQKVLLSIEIELKKLPQATNTDNINDTLCYHNLCTQLKVLNNLTFNTIEYLGMRVYKIIHQLVTPNHLKVEIKKLPIIDNLLGGVKFIIDSRDNNHC